MIEGEELQKIMTEPLACDMAQKKDIDFEGMRLENAVKAKESWAECQEEIKEHPKKDGAFAYFKYGIREGDTLESYVERRTSVSTFAVIKDGKWYQKGQMGWWAMVADEKDKDVWEQEFAKLIDEAPDDEWFALVDCHI
jgi:hypothetical protein